MTFEQEKDLSSIVSFLEKNYGVEIMVPYSKNKLNTLLKRDKSPSDSEIMKALGYQYRSPYDQKDESRHTFNYYFYQNNENTVENIHGYDMIFIISKGISFNCENCVEIEDKSYSIKSAEKDYGTDLQINKDIIPLKIIEFVNKNNEFKEEYNSSKKITQKIETQKYSVLLTYLNVNGKFKNNKKEIDHYQVKVMIKVKK